MGVMRVGNAYDYKMVWRKPRDMYTLVTMIIRKKKSPAQDIETQSIVKWAVPGLHAVSTRHKQRGHSPLLAFQRKC